MAKTSKRSLFRETALISGRVSKDQIDSAITSLQTRPDELPTPLDQVSDNELAARLVELEVITQPKRVSLPPAALCFGVRWLDAAFVFASALAFQTLAVAGPERKKPNQNGVEPPQSKKAYRPMVSHALKKDRSCRGNHDHRTSQRRLVRRNQTADGSVTI